ncbi:phage tail protein [Pseudomonas fulva]|uniref:phage tail protein n=1 Tax=Pseudomonas fulva TaxID=47880 RepID=UPI001E308488|nr:phage tail protein [Pseudomonas fulva]
MGPVDHLEIVGAKGGESQPKQAVESPDSLRSTNIAKILLAVGEGEFDGVPTDRDIYLDNTPIADAGGNVNFPGVKWEWRPGSVEQSYIQGIPSVENETTVNVELRSDNPFTRALSNTQLSAIRVRMSWPRLARQDENGTFGYRIEYAIDVATDGGAFVESLLGAVDGKTTTGYQRSERVNLPKATSGWSFRVRRITPNATSDRIADTMMIAGYSEIIDQKIRYPNTALLYIEFDAQQFQNIPAVTVKCKAKRWPVPSTYDPITRTYSGVWDGTFKLAWTNNPAFVTYGLCVEDRFGLGKRIKPWMVDKWEMYRIAQYCDQLLPNGVGGQEPRFLCDMNLQGRAEAWTLLRDLSAIYRGMVYWAHGSLFMQADMPRAQDIDYVFTRSNVIDGEFVYGGAERSTHYSRALVSYDNPANNYDTDVIPVTDNALQRRYRDRPIELSAIGCTRASEAQRRGKWALLSNSQDRTVTFKTGMEGRIPLPGFVIPVADELVAGRPNGGRISSAAGRVVTLDRDTPIKAGDRLIVNLPNGTAQARTVHSVAGRAVTVTTEYSLQPEPELQWAIDYDDLTVQLFRVLKTTRTQEGNYEITALEFNPSKFAAIDTGAKLDERPISVIPVTTVAPPASVSLSSGHMIDQGIAVSTMTIAWPAVAGAVAYDVEWRKDNGNWVRLQRTGAASVDVVGIYAGAYLARVRSVSAFDITSIWKSSDLTQLNGKEGLPPAVTFLTTESLLFGIGIKWGLPAGAEDTERTELWYSEGTDLGAATKLADLAYPQSEHVMQGLRAGQRFFFWARLVDRSGNVGPFFPVAPTAVTGIASADGSPILEQIKGQVTESELGKELTSKIEKIALIDGNGPGSVNERIGTAKTELAKQISDVNNALSTTKGNLQQQITAVSGDVAAAKADLQQQIANVSALAGSLPYRKDKAYSVGQSALSSDGKLYQALKAVPLNTPPPNTTYWIDVGQAVVTANGMAARVQTVETKVETLEGATSAQAQQISGLQSSLTTTNGNVSAAQQAAQDAATLAGGKGKVIVQSAAPAAADRLAQNLWIDTTSNANTPKRWNGSAWVAVTDKVATDAAAAAAGALVLAQTKADASVVSSLTTRVSDAEGKLTSQATRMDGMQTTIDGKASSQALQQVTSRVTATEDKDKAQDQIIGSQSQALTSLTDSVSKKADASAVQSLGNRVEVAEGALSSQSTDITQLKNSVGAAQPFVAGRAWEFTGSTKGWVATATNGTITAGPLFATVTANPNLQCNFTPIVAGAENPYLRIRLRRRNTSRAGAQMYWANEDGGLAEARRFGWFISTTTTDWQDIELDLSGHAGWNGKKIYAIRLDMMNSGDTSGEIDIAYIAVGRRSASASAEAVSTLSNAVTEAEGKLSSQGQSIVSLQGGLNTANGNVSAAQKAAQDAYSLADAKGKVIVQNLTPSAINQQIQNLWIDTTGGGNTPKRWNGSAWQAVSDKVATDAATAAGNALSQVATKADASTVQSLTNKVEQQGTAITAAGEAITGINASLGQVGGENLLPNPSFEVEGPTAGLADGWRVGSSLAAPNRLLSLVPSTLDPRGKAQRVDAKGLSGSAYVDVALPNASWVSMAPGQVLTVSAYVRGTQDLVSEIYLQYKNSGGATVGTHGPLRTILSDAWNRPVFTGAPAPAGTIGADLLLRVRGPLGGTASDGHYEIDRAQAELSTVVSAWKDNAKNAQSAAQANAVAISSVSGRVSNTEEGLTSVSGRLTQLDNSIGDVGGENLFYNPAFTKLGAATGNNPDGWVPEGTATYTPSMVSSWLNAAENAYRCSTTGVGSTASGNPYTSLVTASERAPAVAPGQTVTSSIYVRKTSDSGDLGMRIFHQWINAAGTVINAPATAVLPMTVDGDRISFTSVAPTGAAKVRVFYRAHAAIGGTVAGTFEVARPQIEYGSRPTGWRDNGQVNSNAIGAVSTAVDGLTSSVSQQGKDITSVSGRTTSLESSVNNGSTGLASKASTAALTSVANRVAATESGLTAQSSSITNLEAKIGNALPFVAGQTWEFTNSVEGWKANTSGATLTAGPQYATVAKFTTIQVTNTFPVIDGAENPLIRIRLRRRNTGRASAAMYWANEDGGLAEARRFNWPINTSSADWQDIELDLSGHAGWNGKKIWAIRLDMYNSTDASGEVDIAYIAAGRRSVAASGRAFDSLSVNVAQQGDKLSAETQRINGLYTSVGNANSAIQDETTARATADSALSTRINTAQAKANEAAAAVQSEVTARADADTALGKRVDTVQSNLGSTNASVQQISTAQTGLNNKVNASYSVRLQVVNGNQYVAAGFGVGVENNGGVLQSTFAVMADKFAILNPSGNGFVNPFSIQGGQVFINEAFVSKLSVQNALVSADINSSWTNAQGLPVMQIITRTGQFIIRHPSRANTYTLFDVNGVDVVVDGVRRVRMGIW